MSKIKQLPDGIYFNLPDETYHAQHRLGSSKIKDLIISPPTFWAKSWMNLNQKEKNQDWKVTGHAYHAARLEPEKFKAEYYRALDKADFDIVTITEIKAELKAAGLPGAKTGEVAVDLALRLRDAGCPKSIYYAELADLEESNENGVALKPDVWDDIQLDASLLRSNSEIQPLLENGQSEVSFLWTEHGIKFQVRFDWLSVNHWADFKTFANPKQKNVDQCIMDAFKFTRYYIQASLYDKATEIIRTSKDIKIYDWSNGETSERDESALIREIQNKTERLETWYIFQEKGGIPNLLAKQVMIYENERLSLFARKAEVEINHAVSQFKQCMEIFGEGKPWQPLQPLGTITDDDFSQYWLES